MPLDRTAFNALIDGTTVWNKNQIKVVILDPVDVALLVPAAPVVSTITLTGTQNDVVIPASCAVLRCNNASLLTITGIAAGVSGQRLSIHAVGAGNVALMGQLGGTASAAANRLSNFNLIGPTMLGSGAGIAVYEYDATATRWKLIAHDQGVAINVPYLNTDFTSPTGSWVVDSGDVLIWSYYQRGKYLSITIYVQLFSVTGTPAHLRLTLPNGWTTVSSVIYPGLTFINNTGGWTGGGVYQVAPDLTYVSIWTAFQGAVWATSVNTSQLQGTVTFELK